MSEPDVLTESERDTLREAIAAADPYPFARGLAVARAFGYSESTAEFYASGYAFAKLHPELDPPSDPPSDR